MYGKAQAYLSVQPKSVPVWRNCKFRRLSSGADGYITLLYFSLEYAEGTYFPNAFLLQLYILH